MTIEVRPAEGHWLVMKDECGKRIADGTALIMSEGIRRIEHIDPKTNVRKGNYMVTGRPKGEGGTVGNADLVAGEEGMTSDGMTVKAY